MSETPPPDKELLDAPAVAEARHGEPVPTAMTAPAGAARPEADRSSGAPLEVVDPRDVVIRFSRRWWWDHTGRIAGGLVLLFVVALLILLAAGGDTSAGAILALIVAGVLMIAVGGRIHGR